MKKILFIVLSLVLFGAYSTQANAEPQVKKDAEKIVDALYGAKGRCRTEDGKPGKWYPTEMTETRSTGSSDSRGSSSSRGNSVTSGFGASLTGPSGHLDASESKSNTSSNSRSQSQESSVTIKYKCF